MNYHDHEWGVVNHDDRVNFEFLILESAQAGLSWHTILKRREEYRRAYEQFDPVKVAEFDHEKIMEMLQDKGIIRNRLKIESSVSNSRHFLRIVEEYGSFDSYLWGFTDGKVIRNQWKTIRDIPANSPLSDLVSKDLKKRGFKFLGSTIMYSHLQSVGIINDHLVSCFRYNQV